MPDFCKLLRILLLLSFSRWAMVIGHRRIAIASPPRAYRASILDFGAVGDGKTLNTRAFQDAIANLSYYAENGGATLYVPTGTWLTGCFNLTSHFTLYLEKGSTILASQNPNDWPVIQALPSYGRGRDLPGPRYSSLIHGEDLTDVVITGEDGIIDGQGSVWWKWFEKGKLKYTRGSLVEFISCTDIILSNTTFKNSPFWTIHPVYCSRVAVVGATILAPHDSHNTDGVDPDSSSDVFIGHTYIETGDDAIAIKSGWDEYGIQYGRPSTNIHIIDVTTVNHNGIALGSEMSGGISNVVIQGISISNSKTGIHVKTAIGRGGSISNISISDITMTNVSTALAFTGYYNQHPDNQFDPSAYSSVSRISIKNMGGSQIKEVGYFKGLDEAPFNQICLTNISVAGKWKSGWDCTNVNGFSENVVPLPCTQLQNAIQNDGSCFAMR